MNEEALIGKIQRWTSGAQPRELILGIGDDCAIFRPAGARHDLLFTTDQMLEGVHFLPGIHRARDIGWKALARSLSDIAAMGGEPLFCLVSLALAPWAEKASPAGAAGWLRDLYAGLAALARRYRVAVAGGDLGRAATVSLEVMVCGKVSRGKALRRDGAKPEDRIYVSGRLGGAALGLETRKGAAWRRHLRPQPRLSLGCWLREKLCASSCIDLSDGLSLDLHRVAKCSRLTAALETPPPAFRGASSRQALHGGDDYELLFTVRPGTAVPARFAQLPLTYLGRMVAGRAGEVTLGGERLAPGGYDHFQEDGSGHESS